MIDYNHHCPQNIRRCLRLDTERVNLSITKGKWEVLGFFGRSRDISAQDIFRIIYPVKHANPATKDCDDCDCKDAPDENLGVQGDKLV